MSIKQMRKTALWNRIRNRQMDGHKFARQVPIGRYICDFVCREKQIVIEVDGGQHSESSEDAVRDRYLTIEGYRVLRFWNNEVLSNPEGVLIAFRPNCYPLSRLCGQHCQRSHFRT